MSLLSLKASCASYFFCRKLTYFGFDRLRHSSIHEGVSSFSSLIVIINKTENADAEMLQLQIHCWQAHFEPYFASNGSGIYYFGVKNLLAPL